MKICDLHEFLIREGWECFNRDPLSGVYAYKKYAYKKGENSLGIYTESHGNSESRVESYRYGFHKDAKVKHKTFNVKVFVKTIKGNYVEFEDFYDEAI